MVWDRLFSTFCSFLPAAVSSRLKWLLVFAALASFTGSLGLGQATDSPRLVQQPEPRNASPGTEVVLQAAAEGAGLLQYQWYRDGTKFLNATSSVLRISEMSSTNAGLFHLVVSNTYGGITSAVVSLTVNLSGSEVALTPRGSLPLRGNPARPGPARIEFQDDFAFVTDLALRGVQVFDTSNPSQPTLVTNIPFLGTEQEDSAILNGYLYLAERTKGLGIVDVRNPRAPVRLPTYRFPVGATEVVTMRVQDRFGYVGNGAQGFSILDLTIPTAPKLVGTLKVPSTVFTVSAGVFVQGREAYLADWFGGFRLLDISNPGQPALLRKYPQNGDFGINYYDLQPTDRSSVVLIDATQGLLVLDLADPSTITAAKPIPGSMWGLDMAGRFVAVADNGRLDGQRPTGGLRIFDLSDRTNAVEVGRFIGWGTVDGVVLRGNRLWVAGARFGAIDLSFPGSAPRVARELATRSLGDDGSAVLEAFVTGAEPFAAQWYQDGQLLPGATNRFLPLTHAQVLEMAEYSLVVQNEFGVATNHFTHPVWAQTVRWVSPTPEAIIPLQQPMQMNAVASSGLPVTFRVLNGPAETSGTQLTITNQGLVRLRAEQAGQASFIAASADLVLNIPEVRFQQLDAWPKIPSGQTYSVLASGSLAYVGLDSGLAVVDVADPAKPLPLGGLKTGLINGQIVLSDGILYSGCKDTTLAAIDVRNPAAPAFLFQRGLGGRVNSVQKHGSLLFVAADTAGLVVLNISEPASPVSIIWYTAANPWQPVKDVRIVGDTAYVAWGDKLVALDIRDPAQPKVLASRLLTEQAVGLELAGNLALVATEHGMDVIDIGRGDLPPIGRGGSGEAVNSISVNGKLVYLPGDYYVQVLDVSNPAEPARLDSVAVASRVRGMQREGNRVYLVTEDFDLQIFEVPSPSVFNRVGGLRTAQTVTPDVEVVGALAYSTGFGGLHILDVSAKTNIVRLGYFDTIFPTRYVEVSDNRAYVVEGDSVLRVIDVSQPEAPVQLGSLVVDGHIAGLQVKDHVACLAVDYRGLQAWDVSNPQSITPLATLVFSGVLFGDIQWVEGFVYATLINDNTFRAFVASQPSKLVEVGTLKMPYPVSSFQVQDGTAFLATPGIRTVDVSIPSRPRLSGDFSNVPGGTTRRKAGDVLWKGSFEGIRLVDISSLSAPISLKGLLEMRPSEVRLDDNLAYLANWGYLQIVETQFGIGQSFELSLPDVLAVGGNAPLLPAVTDRGLSITYTVVKGPARVEANRLMVTGTGAVTLRADQYGTEQFLPVSIQKTIRALDLGTLSIETIGENLRLSWPAELSEYSVQTSSDLGDSSPWRFAAGEVAEIGGQRTLTLPKPPETRYYRLYAR